MQITRSERPLSSWIMTFKDDTTNFLATSDALRQNPQRKVMLKHEKRQCQVTGAKNV